MATTHFYNSPYPGERRAEAPLPPLPSSASSHIDYDHRTFSPVMSPSDDPSYRPGGRRTDQNLGLNNGYYGPAGENPFQDPHYSSDDIPLRQRPPNENTASYSPYHLQHDSNNVNNIPGREHRPSRMREKKDGFFGKRRPWAVYFFTAVQIVVFVAELIKNGVLTKTPIAIHPQFNPMIGPSPYVLINMGARYVPCMRATSAFRDNPEVTVFCPNSTSSDVFSPMNQCTLSELCGFGDHHSRLEHPTQWFRFIIPMFLHAGFVHIGFNMLLQVTLGRYMEKDIGSLRFALVYLSSGIFGFVLGGNFAPEGIASTGASGSLFGVIALMVLDLLYHWGERRSPWVDLAWIVGGIVVSFVLGLLPGLDNFSHIGGFLMGLVLGICILHSPDVLRKRVGSDQPPYAPVHGAQKPGRGAAGRSFVNQPLQFFQGRKPVWWLWWLVRAAALIGVAVCFSLLLKNFYRDEPQKCSWCKYLACLDVNGWCDIGELKTSNATSNNANKRDLSSLFGHIVLDPFS